ncbi:MAG: DUF3267 domain-containing protein [Anaerolineaceae bacterium]|nr:DUF3267 domain-containing protein [Anaerolineaceae bacterium]
MEQKTIHATRELPAGYRQIGRLDLLKDKRILIIMNILGLGLVVVFGWLFTRALLWLRPQEAGQIWSFSIVGWSEMLRGIAAIVGVVAAAIILHEGMHGLFFWWYTRSRPKFEFKIIYASASAPGWYIPRGQYILIGLAPLVWLSLLGVAALSFLPAGWLSATIAFLVFNASGAVGDIVAVAWILLHPRGSLALDETSAIVLFGLPSMEANKNRP